MGVLELAYCLGQHMLGHWGVPSPVIKLGSVGLLESCLYLPCSSASGHAEGVCPVVVFCSLQQSFYS